MSTAKTVRRRFRLLDRGSIDDCILGIHPIHIMTNIADVETKERIFVVRAERKSDGGVMFTGTIADKNVKGVINQIGLGLYEFKGGL